MDGRLSALISRIDELADDQLDDVAGIVTEHLTHAADRRDIADARALSAALDRVRAEQRQRSERARAAEQEMRSILRGAGLADDEPDPQPMPDPESLVAALKPDGPSIKDLASVRRRTNRATTTTTPADHLLADIAENFVSKLRTVRASTSPGRVTVHTVTGHYPASRTLGRDPSANLALLQAEMQSLVASGGVCAPQNAYYDQLGSSSVARPVRDGLPQYQATHGGIVFTAPPTLADVESGTGIHTNADDVAGSTKNIVTLVCQPEQEQLVHAVTQRLRLSNFNAQFNGETVEAWLRKLMAAHARLAEERLLSQITTGSTPVNTAQLLGATRDLISAVDQASAALRFRARMTDSQPLTAIIPQWGRAIIRADLVRQHSGDSTYAPSDAEIARWFSVRSIVPVWHLDGSGDWVPQTGSADLINWPDTIDWWLFPAGSWLYLDGATIDLGLVRDSTLNATNDTEFFAETFEAAAFVGDAESFAVTSSVCATGESAGPIDTGCTIGS